MGYLKARPGWRSALSTDKGNVINALTLGCYSHAGLLFGSGTSSTVGPTSAVADKKFASFYTISSATSGESYAFYWRHTLSGAGSSGTGARFYVTSNVASATVQAAQISAGLGASGTISGLMCGVRSQLILPDDHAAFTTGTFCGGQSEVYWEGDNSSTTDISAAPSSCIHRFILDGDTTARAKIGSVFEFVNLSTGSGAQLFSTGYLTASHGIRAKINGAYYYILCDAV